jgi:tRNA pseudouridine38-40 synthase
MTRAAAVLVGEHDFASFARPGHGRETTVRTILACELSCRPPKLVIGIEGTGFLWNMVRIIVGTLVQVGLGRYTPDDVQSMLAAKNRQSSGPTAPPHGLYLQWIRTNPVHEEIVEEEARSQESEVGSEESEIRSQEEA